MGLRLKGEVALDGSGFEGGLKRLDKAAMNAFSSVRNQLAAAFGVGAISAFAKKTIEFAGYMRDLSDETRVNVEWLQKMNNALAQNGSNAEELAKFITQIGKSREEAAKNPTGKEASAFGRLGMSSGDITGLSQQDFVGKLIKGFAGSASLQAENDLMAVGGKTGRKMISTFRQGIESGGPIISEEVIDTLDEVGDQFFLLTQQLKRDLAPVLAELSRLLVPFMRFSGLYTSGSIALGKKAILKDETALPNWMAESAETVQTFESEQAIRRMQRKLERAMRRRREKTPPQFESDLEPLKELPQKAAPKLPSDALIAVGNFLGSNRSNIETIGRETNLILRQSKSILTEIRDNLSASATPQNSMGIPET